METVIGRQPSYCSTCSKEIDATPMLTFFPCLHAYHKRCYDFFYGLSCKCYVCEPEKKNVELTEILKNPSILYLGDQDLETREQKILDRLLCFGATEDKEKITAVRNHINGRKVAKKISSDNASRFTTIFKQNSHYIYHEKRPSNMIDDRCSILDLIEYDVTMSKLLSCGITTRKLLMNGYGLLAWVCMMAKWSEILEAGLCAEDIIEYPLILNVNTMVLLYNPSFIDIYETVCESSKKNFCLLGLDSASLKIINFTAKEATEIKLEKGDKLWSKINPEQQDGRDIKS